MVDTHAFIQEISTPAKETMKRYKILASLTMAQAILESSWGKSELSSKYHNYFGIKVGTNKGSNFSGSVNLETHEVYNGVDHRMTANFRTYDSIGQCFDDHAILLTSLARYHNLIGLTDYKRAAFLIRKDGYATDPAYTEKLVSIIQEYHLDQYDREAEAELKKEVEQKAQPKQQPWAYAVEPIKRMVSMGVTKSGARPLDNCTRQEVMTLLDNFAQMLLEDSWKDKYKSLLDKEKAGE